MVAIAKRTFPPHTSFSLKLRCVLKRIKNTFNIFFSVDVCHGYTNLSSADRKITQIASSFLCDNTLVFGWYRFNGDAGTRMATTCPSFTLGRCAALRQGWLSGTHPNAEEGEVSRKVCFTFKTCCSRTVHVKVKNCGSYYVYRLQPPPDCPYRYCGAD